MPGINIPLNLPGPNGEIISIMANAENVFEGQVNIYKFPKTQDHPHFNLKHFNNFYKENPYNYGVSDPEGQIIAVMCKDGDDLIKLGERLIEIGNVIKSEMEVNNGKYQHTI